MGTLQNRGVLREGVLTARSVVWRPAGAEAFLAFSRWRTMLVNSNGFSIDKEPPFAVSLKGFRGHANSIRSNARVRLKRTAQAESDSVFDNRLNVPVVRLNLGFRVRAISQEQTVRLASAGQSSSPSTRRGRSGFKREFDPGSESTLAACLTHASRTRKRGQLRE